mmetsp:Transcript_33852/g.35157  ORF Transcript_33852/g.35157 Transcript_33852/m.35157 type:complete len:150 (-) Transcript_33852:309-758(-)
MVENSKNNNKALIGGALSTVAVALAVGFGINYYKNRSEQTQSNERQNAYREYDESEKVNISEKKPDEISIKSSSTNNKNVSPHFFCPISHELMRDPVVTPHGISFERKSIENHLKAKSNCPITKKELKKEQLSPNNCLKQLIEEYIKNK